MTVPNPAEFSAAWVKAWNAHDVEAVLSHFHDDVVFTSPVAAQLIEASRGTLRGKTELRHYWVEGLALIPDLHFTVENVYAGLDAIVINYRNQKGNLVNEVLIFDDGLVVEGHGTYLSGDENPAGARER
ncbi:nuclear transport factor 2 family protein [Leifsonia sp. Root112D2]|uniref:nuclear transport factor 2 family protein n=1 Tax=Leifsonia sp. Root112D2 TaxID=1736426 RepID=UPI0006FF9FDB|nr:nuclear transport factor 2 family protein [Leifsonia sp. Root112D2]KQV08177.1 polyketide cyclase [Leifsonia sp. Root112D2]